MIFNIRHLLCSLEIQKLGTLSKASEYIHLSQSALTQAINKLEQQLGYPLFERSNSGMFTNDIGTIFLARLQRAFNHLNQLSLVLFDKEHKRQAFVRSLTTKQLIALTTIVDTQNYTEAAIQLGLTQPTLGKTIKDLEFITQQKLFQRVPSGVEPTWRARQLAKTINLFFAEVAQGLDEIQAFVGLRSGSIKIGSLPLARTRIIPDLVLKLLSNFPNTKISIIDGSYHEQLNALLHGQVDVIVGALRYPAPTNEIEQIKLFEDSLSLVSRVDHPSKSLLQNTIEDIDLNKFTWIAPQHGTPTRAAFSTLFTAKGLAPPEDIIECSSLVAIRGLLLNSDRVSLLSARQVAEEVQAGLLAISDKPLLNTGRAIGYTLRKGWKPTNVQAKFIALLNEL